MNLGEGGATVYSFATSKILSGLGGAVVISHNLPLIERIRSVAYYGQNFRDMEEISSFGANFKMNDMNASIALAHFKRRDEIFAKRRSLQKLYAQKLSPLIEKGLITMQVATDETVITHLAVRLPQRNAVARHIFDNHRILICRWPALHLQRPYRDRFGCRSGTLPVTEVLDEEIAFLPFYDSLTEDDVTVICDALSKALENQ